MATDRTAFEQCDFGPPDQPGVYMVCARVNGTTGAEHVLYIGSSDNIRTRVNGPTHPYRRLFDHFKWPVLIYTRSLVTSNYRAVEIEAIQSLRPLLNIAHNG